MLESALEHCDLLDRLGFTRYCVSLKDSDPARVVEVNRRFAAERPEVPLHLGVTEAGMPPEGILKTRVALEPLLSRGHRRHDSRVADGAGGAKARGGRGGPADSGRRGRRPAAATAAKLPVGRLNIISCPSCSRVENEAFVELAERVREATRYAAEYPITIAVMGCRVNGPGETDHADLGLWCGPNSVNLKRGGTPLGAFSYDEVLARLKLELDALIAASASVDQFGWHVHGKRGHARQPSTTQFGVADGGGICYHPPRAIVLSSTCSCWCWAAVPVPWRAG